MRFRPSQLLAVPIVALSLVSTTLAHHSVSGQFDTTKQLTLKGVISKVEWINPHIYLQLEVKGDDGTVTTWVLESLPTAMMRKAGLSKESFTGHDVVTVQVIPARDGSKHLAFLQLLTFADGRFFKLG